MTSEYLVIDHTTIVQNPCIRIDISVAVGIVSLPHSPHANSFYFLWFTLHMMSANSPSIFSKVNLSSGMLSLVYTPGKSKTATYIPLCESIMSLVNRASNDMVCEDTSYLGM